MGYSGAEYAFGFLAVVIGFSILVVGGLLMIPIWLRRRANKEKRLCWPTGKEEREFWHPEE